MIGRSRSGINLAFSIAGGCTTVMVVTTNAANSVPYIRRNTMLHASIRALRAPALAVALMFGVAGLATVNAQETVVPTSSGLPPLDTTVVATDASSTTSAASTTDAATTDASTTSVSTTDASTTAVSVTTDAPTVAPVVTKTKKDNTGRWGLLGLLGLAGLTGLLRRGSTVPIEPPVTRTVVEPVVTRTVDRTVDVDPTVTRTTIDRTDTDTRR